VNILVRNLIYLLLGLKTGDYAASLLKKLITRKFKIKKAIF